jgi:hypothetical protein
MRPPAGWSCAVCWTPNTQDPLFPVWRYHPFFTNSTEPAQQADITHRSHAICDTVWSDLIDGPCAHQPSGSFAANTAWAILAAICHNLLRAAAATLTGTARYAVARGATLRTHLINIPARLARPQRRPRLHLPTHWPRATAWLRLWKAVFVTCRITTWHRHTTTSHQPLTRPTTNGTHWTQGPADHHALTIQPRSPR